MSVDIFSLRAVENIAISLEEWSKKLRRGMEDNQEPEELPISSYDWRLRFAGYVSQQYITKRDAMGNVRPTAAYERISKRIPETIKQHFLIENKPHLPLADFDLGSVPTLHSIIPMSQNARAPVFALKSDDGVVGAHFLKVKELKETFRHISDRLSANIQVLDLV